MSRFVSRIFSLVPFSIATTAAGLQGPPIDLPKLLKLDPPKIERLKLDELFGMRPMEVAKPAAESRPVDSPPLATTTTVEQHAVFVSYVREFEVQRAKAAGVSDTLDQGVALIHLGRYTDALNVLLELEAAQPGRYETAARLALACELAGIFEEAVLWLARGIERNPALGQGTEWLHAAILHAKIKLREDPQWLTTHTVLEGTAARSAEEIVRAIDYQLGERLSFAKPADAVVCDLFYQAALRVEGPDAEGRRAYYLGESLHFGDWRKAEIMNLPKT